MDPDDSHPEPDTPSSPPEGGESMVATLQKQLGEIKARFQQFTLESGARIACLCGTDAA